MRMSEKVSLIAQALADFQKEVKNPANTAENPFFKSKYAPLNEILNDVRPLLAKQGLSIIQNTGGNGEVINVTTMLLHVSGEWYETCPLVLKPDKNTPQGAGSAITYARRYQLSAILGISSEDDDDGNNASNNKPAPDKGTPKKDTPKNEDKVTETQVKKIFASAKEAGLSEENIKKNIQLNYKKDSVKDLTKKQASLFIEKIEAHKQQPKKESA